MSKTKIHKTYNLALKIAILLLAYWVLYRQIFVKHSAGEIVSYFQEQYRIKDIIGPVIAVFLMMFLNWSTEAIKWRYLVAKSEQISTGRSLKGVFSGVTISSMTPNRVGEYFGRVFILRKTHPLRGIFITIVGSISQLLVTIFFGSLGLTYVILWFPKNVFLEGWLMQAGALLLTFTVLFFLGGIYFNIGFLSGWIKRVVKSRWRKYVRFVDVFSWYDRKELLNVFLYSFLRYCIFSLQFYILMRLFHIDVSLGEGYLLISLIFLAITAIPSVALAELGIRGSVAIYVVSIYFAEKGVLPPGQLNLDVMASTTLLWFINIVLPALIGSVFIFDLSFFNNKKKNND